MARQIAYQLDNLDWLHFENLVQVLLKAELGLGVEAWGGSADHGQDAYCESELNFPNRHTVNPGPFVFQAKFIAGANAAGAKFEKPLVDAVSKEVTLIHKRRASRRQPSPQHYGFLTNAPITATQRNKIRLTLKRALPRTTITILGASDICGLLDANLSIARTFPQILSLRNLTELLENVVRNGSLQKSEAVIREAEELSKVFVPTGAYERAWQVLKDHHFVVLEGPPEMGKTAIAWMIAAVQLTQNWQAVDCDSPDEFFDRYKSERKQVFVADDAFGTTEYETTRGSAWGRQMHKILPKLDGKHWLIWTSRMHILQKALHEMSLQGKAGNFPRPGEVVVSASNIARDERALILYRHARAARLTPAAKAIIRKNATSIIDSPHFTPERTRRLLIDSLPELSQRVALPNTSDIDLLKELRKALEHPTDRMRKAFEKLEQTHKWMLIALLDCNRRASLEELEQSFRRFAEIRRPIAEEVTLLEEGFLEVTGFGVDWIHPSYRDLVIEELERDENTSRHFLQHCSLTGLELAVSVAGGARGDRRFPLMAVGQSWEIVRKRFVQALQTATDQFDVWAVLRVLHSAVESAADLPEILDHLSSILDECCVEAKLRLDSLRRPLLSFVLEQFFDASMCLSPPPLMPSLFESTKKVEAGFATAIKEADDGRPLDATAVEEWASVLRIVAQSDQRILRQAGFPDAYRDKLKHMCSLIESEIDAGSSFGELDGWRSEAERIRKLSSALQDLLQILPELAETLLAISQRLEDEASRIAERCGELEGKGTDVSEPVSRQQSFDLDRLFAAL